MKTALDVVNLSRTQLMELNVYNYQEPGLVNNRSLNPLSLAAKKILQKQKSTAFVPELDSTGTLATLRIVNTKFGSNVLTFVVKYKQWNERSGTTTLVHQCLLCIYSAHKFSTFKIHMASHYNLLTYCLFCRYEDVGKKGLCHHGAACQPFYSKSLYGTFFELSNGGEMAFGDVQQIYQEILKTEQHVDVDNNGLELMGGLSLYEKYLPAFFKPITFESSFDEFFAKSTKILDESEQEDDPGSEREDESESKIEKLSTIYATQMDPNDLTALKFFESDLYPGSTIAPRTRFNLQQNGILDLDKTKSVAMHLSEAKKRGDKVYRILVISNIKEEFRYDYEAALKCAMELCAKGNTWNQNPVSRKKSETRDWSF